eukprot:Lankesteria_metandrocarpae@DN3697_c0_g1_i1.p2
MTSNDKKWSMSETAATVTLPPIVSHPVPVASSQQRMPMLNNTVGRPVIVAATVNDVTPHVAAVTDKQHPISQSSGDVPNSAHTCPAVTSSAPFTDSPTEQHKCETPPKRTPLVTLPIASRRREGSRVAPVISSASSASQQPLS